eukprot:1084418-Pyramimonas_sp.AAC.1
MKKLTRIGVFLPIVYRGFEEGMQNYAPIAILSGPPRRDTSRVDRNSPNIAEITFSAIVNRPIYACKEERGWAMQEDR